MLGACGITRRGTYAAIGFPDQRFLVEFFIARITPEIRADALMQILGKRLGQPFVIENRTGAGATIGFEAFAASPPDGSAARRRGSSRPRPRGTATPWPEGSPPRSCRRASTPRSRG